MTTSRLRTAIIVLTTITALIHLILLNLGGLDLLFLLNGIGFFFLLWALLFATQDFVVRMRHWVYYLYIAFTLLTILAYFSVYGSGGLSNPIGLVTKIVEALLIVALFMHMRQTESA
ncbi:MAG: hypothetical protein DWQ07_03800 [Chloroflexi bacterium]|nr:MAG: hypothetical protein DWQ07_03800 [Chloroflexota bacterium]MBL1193373.1 hypothetical protein [Chloroflexota bacterium]NOH10665.1 hypothetical protein [Chloroflexota bacterium]